MKSAGKARNNGLYRHIRTSKEIIRNLLNDSPQILNSADDLFGYNRNLPSALVCTNSFRLSGFNYTITCFSDNQSDMLAQNELTAFSNALLAFLSEKR